MSYIRSISPIPLTAPCSTCGRLDVSEYPGDEYDQWDACNAHQMWWARGPWWNRWFEKLIWLVFGRNGTLSGRPARWLRSRGRGLCPECTSHWYVYWDVCGKLAVWAAHYDENPMYTYEEVCEIVETGNYDKIPGFAEYGDQGVLSKALAAFIEDYQEENKGDLNRGDGG